MKYQWYKIIIGCIVEGVQEQMNKIEHLEAGN